MLEQIDKHIIDNNLMLQTLAIKQNASIINVLKLFKYHSNVKHVYGYEPGTELMPKCKFKFLESLYDPERQIKTKFNRVMNDGSLVP